MKLPTYEAIDLYDDQTRSYEVALREFKASLEKNNFLVPEKVLQEIIQATLDVGHPFAKKEPTNEVGITKLTAQKKPRKKLGKRQIAWDSWVESSTQGASDRFTVVAAMKVLKALDSPVSRVLLRHLKDGSVESLKRVSRADVDPLQYKESEKYVFRRDYLAAQLLSKNQFLKTKVDKERVAKDKFAANEARCGATNDRFQNLNLDPLFIENQGVLSRVFHRMWYWTNKVIGDGPTYEDFFSLSAWGPGVTQSIKGSNTSAANKFQAERTATSALWAFVGPLWKANYPHWELGDTDYSCADEIITVLKNAMTDRTIGVGPGLNVWFQKSLGLWLRGRLKMVAGVDLNKGQEVHAELARLYSITGEGATMDFSSASDLIAYLVVKFALQASEGARRFFRLLDICRVPCYKLDGELKPYEKFSGMGNGYTFELETLIFWAIARACADVAECGSEAVVSVYGDDVILPTGAVELFCKTSDVFGFKLNSEKSFSSGHFRESCGAHFFAGLDCKPIYMKEPLKNGKETITFANQVRLAAHRFTGGVACDDRFASVWKYIYETIPESVRVGAPLNSRVIPSVRTKCAEPPYLIGGQVWPVTSHVRETFMPYTDGALILNFDEASPRMARDFAYKAKEQRLTDEIFYSYTSDGLSFERGWNSVTCNLSARGWEGWIVSHFADVPVRESAYTMGLYLSRLHSPSQDRAGLNSIELRGQTETRYSEFLVDAWRDIGPWINNPES